MIIVKTTPSSPNAFTTDGLLFPAEDLIDIPGNISGSIDASGKIKLSAEDITLNAGGLSLTGASTLLTNDKIEMIGHWLGLSLALRAQIEENSFSLAGDTSYETGINIIRNITLPPMPAIPATAVTPAIPASPEIDLGQIHIHSSIGVDVHIGMSLETISVSLNVSFTCLGDHSISFEVEELPETIDDFADQVRQKVEEWALDNLLPDALFPTGDELLPDNPFVSVTGKLAGNLTPEGEIYLAAENVSLSALNDAFTLAQADAVLANEKIEVTGKWLNTLDVTLAVTVTANNIALSGNTKVEINSFDIDLPYSNLPNPFGTMLSSLTDTLSCSANAEIDIAINNDSFNADIDLDIDCLGVHSLPTFSISGAPNSMNALVETIKNNIINWVQDFLSPDTLLPWGGLFPGNDYIELTGDLHGKLAPPDLMLKIENTGFKLLKGKLPFTSVDAELSTNRLYIHGDFSIIDISLITLKGNATTGITSACELTLSGSLTAATGVIGLSQNATLTATDLGKSTGELTITGSFDILDTALLKIGGTSLSATLSNTDLSVSGTLSDVSGFLGLANDITISGDNLLTTGNVSATGSFSLISNYLIELSGTATVTAYRNGNLKLSGDLTGGLKFFKLNGCTIEVSNLKTTTRVTITGSFTINTTYLKISGDIDSAYCDTNGNFKIDADFSSSTGTFSIGSGSVLVQNNYIKISTTWLGYSFDLSATNNVNLSGNFGFAYDFSNLITLPAITDDFEAVDPTGLVSSITKDFTEAARSVGASVTVTVTMNVAQTTFTGTATGTVSIAGTNTPISVSVSAGTTSISTIKNKILAEIESNKSSIWSGEIADMVADALAGATNKAQQALKDLLNGMYDTAYGALTTLKEALQTLKDSLPNPADIVYPQAAVEEVKNWVDGYQLNPLKWVDGFWDIVTAAKAAVPGNHAYNEMIRIDKLIRAKVTEINNKADEVNKVVSALNAIGESKSTVGGVATANTNWTPEEAANKLNDMLDEKMKNFKENLSGGDAFGDFE